QDSGTMKMKELAGQKKKEGKNIISFTVGEPDFDTPRHIVEAAKKALDEGKTRYLNAPGLPELREAIAQRAKAENGIPCESSNVLITPTKHAIFETIMATINEGDEVLMPDPSWVTYEPCVQLAGGKAVPVTTTDESQFRFIPEAVAELITPKTKMILFNSPSNPCGAVETHEDIKGLSDLAKDHNLLVLSDEVYEKIVFDGMKHFSIAAEPGMMDRTITISGFSKTYAMTGWRMGWLIAPAPIFKGINKIQQHSITHAVSFAQYGGLAAITGTQEPVKMMVKEFEERRNLIMSLMKEIPSFSCGMPKGAFYVFPKYEGKMNSEEMALYLMDNAEVAMTGGSSFGSAGEKHLRISYATNKKNIQDGMERIKKALA
ncbi:MAG: pyridoxal phosphate-dependent aminotransferase, partial [Candidatus Thermoplasmatota archaeon]|nr:pyridoxal phosphate-dependent aminotransferase [Candidatus Thermoplasmatota archaeon]